MRLGLNIGYWSGGDDPAERLALVREAERLGFATVWTAEAYGSDAATPLAWLAGQTSTISLGAAILQLPARSAAMTAMTAATLDVLSGGRLRLGLGTSGPQVAEGWHGQRFARQLTRTREYIEVVRMALRRERVAYAGATLQLPLPDGPGKPLKLTISPVQSTVPIYLAAIGPRNVALAAEIADGWLPHLFSPAHASVFAPSLEAGFAASGVPGKTVGSGFEIVAGTPVVVTDDLAAGRDAIRPMVALYVGGMGSRSKNFYRDLVGRYGFADAAAEVQEHYLGGDPAAAAAALPDELIDAVSLCGPVELVRERLEVYRSAGVAEVALQPLARTHEERLATLRAVAGALG